MVLKADKILKRAIRSEKNYFVDLKTSLLKKIAWTLGSLTHYITPMKHLSMESSILLPPKHVRGMTVLDRTKFSKTVKIPRLEIGDESTASVLPYIKKYLLKMENLKALQSIQDSNGTSSASDTQKIILLNPVLVKSWQDIEGRSLEQLVPLGITEKSFKIEDLNLKYENWRADEILKAVLPVDKDGLTSYSLIGHIVHVNLKDHLLPYKKLIGEVLLDKIKLCKTVVNKLDSIDSTYRFFKMEVLSGENNMMCQVKENHCRFKFDFSKVYWNPRLCTEHERITNNLKENDVLYDVFAGVGPFAIPAAKKKCIVLANDLNPDCYKWLNHNSEMNKIKPDYLKTFNLDGRVFILSELKNDFIQRHKNNTFKNKIHVTMNLPATAVEFLDTFCGLFKADDFVGIDNISLPIVHVYCFVKGDSPHTLARALIETHLGFKLDNNLIKIFNVRNVSHKKEMVRVTFQLTRDILFGTVERTLRKRMPSGDDDKTTDSKKLRHGKKEESRIQSGGSQEPETQSQS